MQGRLTLQRLDDQTDIQDDLTYEYNDGTNRLRNTDPAAGENYTYDKIGNLISDAAEGIDSIIWTPYGKVRAVVKDDDSKVRFRYDASGNRIAKIAGADTTVYVRDASGNVMAVYRNDTLAEQSIYGSSRLGLMTSASKAGYRTLGGKKYELSNHLGNVLAVVSDNIHLDQDSTWANVVNVTDYYPFGLAMEGRTVQDSSYRYGFNGKERDDTGEWGSKSHYDYGFRIYNPSIAKFLSVDPLASSFPWNSTYAFAEGSPMSNIDLDGLEKLDFRTHLSMGVASGNPVQGLVTYPLDWLEDKIVGGSQRYIEGGFKYAQNKRNHQEYLERPNQHYPANIEKINHLASQAETVADAAAGLVDVLEGTTTLVSAAMGGIESVAANSFAKGAASLVRPASIVQGTANDVVKPGIANSRALGIAGEQAVGVSGSKTAINVGGRTRIPDRLTSNFLEEVKNVKHQSFTRQLRDFYQYSQDNDLQMILHTRPNTTFSKPLEQLIDNGSIIRKNIPEN